MCACVCVCLNLCVCECVCTCGCACVCVCVIVYMSACVIGREEGGGDLVWLVGWLVGFYANNQFSFKQFSLA